MYFNNTMMTKKSRNLSLSVAAGILLAGLSACDLMHDTSEPCATTPAVRTIVNFVYDYNLQNTDLFSEHVGLANHI